MDPEMREALDRLGADLRGEIRAGDAETRAYVDERFQTSEFGMRVYIDGRLQTSESGMRAYIDERLQTSESGMRAYIDERLEVNTGSLLHEMRESESRTRRYFGVVGESLRGEIRGLAELIGLSNEDSRRRDDEQAGREDNRKPRRPRPRR